METGSPVQSTAVINGPGTGRGAHLAGVAALAIGSIASLPVPDGVKLVALGIASLILLAGGPVPALFVTAATLPLAMQTLVVRSSEWSPLELSLLASGLVVGCWATWDIAQSRSLAPLSVWLPRFDLRLLAISLIVIALMSLKWVAEPDLLQDSIRAFRRVIVEPLMIIPVAVFAQRTRQIRGLAFWIAIPAIAVSGLALVQLIWGSSTVDIGGFARPIGTFTHPNNLSFYLERSIWFVPIAAMSVRANRNVVWFGTAIVLAACLATLSRGSAIALVAGGIVFGWTEVRHRIRLIIGIALALGGAVFATRFFAESGESVGSRVDIWRASIHMIQDHPFTGVGLDQFLGQYGTRYVLPNAWAERYTSHPHNLVLDFWLSLGIAGLITLWLLCEATWVRLRYALNRPDWSVTRGSVALLAAGLTHGLIDNSFFLPYLAAFTWLGLVLAMPQSDGDTGE